MGSLNAVENRGSGGHLFANSFPADYQTSPSRREHERNHGRAGGRRRGRGCGGASGGDSVPTTPGIHGQDIKIEGGESPGTAIDPTIPDTVLIEHHLCSGGVGHLLTFGVVAPIPLYSS